MPIPSPVDEELLESRPSRALKAIVVASEPARMRAARRVLQAVAEDVVYCKTLAQVEGDSHDLVVVDYGSLSEADRNGVFERFAPAHEAGRLLLQLVDEGRETACELFGRGARHILSGDGDSAMADLRATARKIISNDLFGPEKYLGWGGHQWSARIHSSNEKGEVMALGQDVADSLSIGDRRREQLEILLEELVSNALYNAPVDAAMNRLHAARPRTDPVALSPRDAVEVQFATDGVRLAVSVTDPFGSLPPETVTTYLAKCLAQGAAPMDDKPGGAGLGLYYSYSSVSHLIINIATGQKTEVVGLIDLHGPPGAVDRQPHPLNLFIAR
jgi:hypothetical protein